MAIIPVFLPDISQKSSPAELSDKVVLTEGVFVPISEIIALASAGSGGASVGVQYLADLDSTVDSDPGPGLLKWNNAAQASATKLYLDDQSSDGASLTGWWSALVAGGFAYLQSATDQGVWQIWEITAVADAAGYVKLDVDLLAHGADFADEDQMLVTLQQGFVSAGGSFTNPMTMPGDIIAGGSSGIPTRVAIGTEGEYLRVIAGVTNWGHGDLQSFIVALSDLITNIAVGTGKGYFYAPYDFVITEVQAALFVAQTAGSLVTVDANVNGTSILTTRITIDNNEKTSATAAAPPVIASPNVVKGDLVTFDLDTVGTAGAKGLQAVIIGYIP